MTNKKRSLKNLFGKLKDLKIDSQKMKDEIREEEWIKERKKKEKIIT
jgi:hypothetical protein